MLAFTLTKIAARFRDELAEKFKMYPTVVFAKMDATANEHGRVEVKGFPTIQFYDMRNSMFQFDGARDLETLTAFVTRHAGVQPLDNMHEEL